MRSRRIIISILLLLCAAISKGASPFTDSLATRYSVVTKWCSPEKLYLHIDRTYYAAGETIWYMGYLANASSVSAYPLSRYIYVELLDGSANVVSRAKIKMSEDGFPGHLDIPETAADGHYTLRAYTLWNMNNDPEYMFNQDIRVLGSSSKPAQAPEQGGLDVTFYPESGRYFEGVPSVIAFKAMDGQGRSVSINGWIVKDDGSKVARARTMHDGMGMFSFTPEKGVRYSLETESGRVFHLPEAASDGAVINLKYDGGHIYAAARGFGGKHAALLLRDNFGISPLAEFEFDGKSRLYVIESSYLLPGINHLIVVDDSGTIFAERLFFVYDKAENTPSCSVVKRRMKDLPRSAIDADVTLSDASGSPLDGQFSVSVVRAAFKEHHQDDGIVSYMRLSSELKGHINDPYHYFDSSVPEDERISQMDMLMMVQGWRYYDLSKILSRKNESIILKHTKEKWQEIRGRIDRSIGHKTPKRFIFGVMIPKLGFKRFMEVEEGNNFIIDSLDFPENTEFLINASRTGLGFGYQPKWNGDVLADAFKYHPAPGDAAEITPETDIPMANGVWDVDTLNAAVVTAEKEETFGSTIFGHTVSGRELETYRNYTLIEFLRVKAPTFEYDGESMHNRNFAGSMRNFAAGTYSDEESPFDLSNDTFGPEEESNGSVMLIVDDIQQPWFGYDMLYVDDIAGIAISTHPDPVYGSSGGSVAIKLKSPDAVKRFDDRSPSLLYCVPLGYQQPKEFYSPRYDRGEKAEDYDSRNTIYWNPAVRLSNGKARLQFCSSDQLDWPYYVRVEGLTASGIPFSHYCELDI